ncbi:hypothetical protein LMG28614_03830 [Paraburkholderia ultramafica]|uniref:Uncharacterized protein n=1 Tax=Paraburkholderia ultramafica TaxID=1544867 RepID=A0A6S7BAV3_9BURK|nr:hypothetical protein LMG28614_03830 [Paraburkholderia ultramafica]
MVKRRRTGDLTFSPPASDPAERHLRRTSGQDGGQPYPLGLRKYFHLTFLASVSDRNILHAGGWRTSYASRKAGAGVRGWPVRPAQCRGSPAGRAGRAGRMARLRAAARPRLLYSVAHWGVAAPRHVRTAVPGCVERAVRGAPVNRLGLHGHRSHSLWPGETDDPHAPQQGPACRGSSLVHILPEEPTQS